MCRTMRYDIMFYSFEAGNSVKTPERRCEGYFGSNSSKVTTFGIGIGYTISSFDGC